MRVVFITNSVGFGGAEKMLAFVANGLAVRGHNVAIVNFSSEGGAYINEYEQSFKKNIDIYTYHRKYIGKINHIHKIFYVKRIVLQYKADVMVCFTRYPSFVGKIIHWLTGIPSIMSERGNPYVTIDKKNLFSLFSLFVINQSSGGVFQITGASEFYSKRLQKKSVVIPNPIFINNQLKDVVFAEREKSVVSVGRLDNFQKRYDVMIKAFSIFWKKHPEWILKLYGLGHDENLIREWCKNEGVHENVRFMGLTKQPMSDICRDGIFLITSDYEGISNSLLEAMAVGLPCVSTDSEPGGARMLINNMSNGLLAPVRNPEMIAEAISFFADNPSIAEDCGKKAKDVIKRFDKEVILNKWEAYIAKVISNN